MTHYRSQVVWTGVAGSPCYTTIRSFAGEGNSDDFRGGIFDFVTDLLPFVTAELTANFDGTVQLVTDSDEDLVNIFSETPFSLAGTAAQEPLPRMAQILVSLGTDEVVTGPSGRARLLRGRMNIPGATIQHLHSGLFTSTLITGVTAAINELDATVGLGVYSPGGSLIAAVTSTNVATKPATLRSRNI